MTTAQIAFWGFIIGVATLTVYTGQLIVLILVYLRVIKETDRNAQERQRAIDKAGDDLQAINEQARQGLNKIAGRNALLMAALCALNILILFTGTRRRGVVDRKG